MNKEDLIKQILEWRNEPSNVHKKTHTDRWDRVLLFLGESVNYKSLTPMPVDSIEILAKKAWGSRWRIVNDWIKDNMTIQDIETSQSTNDDDSIKVSAKPGSTTTFNTSNANNNDYSSQLADDYKDACKVINELRGQVQPLELQLARTEQQLRSAREYGERQNKRANELDEQLKKGGVSDEEFEMISDKYEEAKEKVRKLNDQLIEYQDGKVSFEQMVKAVMDDKIINVEILTNGAKHLKPEDRLDLNAHVENVRMAMKQIDTWLWDITHVPGGVIGERYKGKSPNKDMADMLDLIDTVTHQAYQTMQVIVEFGKKMEEN